MKKIILTTSIVFVLMAMSITTIAEEKFKPQKFDVTFKIKYQSKTLIEIAEIEELIQSRNKKACLITIDRIENCIPNWGFITIRDLSE